MLENMYFALPVLSNLPSSTHKHICSCQRICKYLLSVKIRCYRYIYYLPGTQVRGAQTALLALILWAYLIISSEEIAPVRNVDTMNTCSHPFCNTKFTVI